MGLVFCQQASAVQWMWGGLAPWIFNNEDKTWYFVGSANSSVILFGGNSNILLAAPQGNSPASLTGSSIEPTIPDLGTSVFNFTSATRYEENNPSGNFSGDYRYVKTGNNTALLVLLEDFSGGNIVVADLVFTSPNEGTLSGRTTDIGDTSTFEGTFVIR